MAVGRQSHGRAGSQDYTVTKMLQWGDWSAGYTTTIYCCYCKNH